MRRTCSPLNIGIADIIKIGGILLDDSGRLLVTRTKGKDFWVFLGGKIEPQDGNSHEKCLEREIFEEISIKIVGEPEFYFKSPVELAAGKPDLTVQIFAYIVKIKGIPVASNEVDEIHWLSVNEFKEENFRLGSVLHDHVIPMLIRDGLMR